MMRLLIVTLLSLLLFACRHSQNDGENSNTTKDAGTTASMNEKPAPSVVSYSTPQEKTDKTSAKSSKTEPSHIIKTADIKYKVKDFKKTKKLVDEIIRKSGGIITEQNQQNDGWTIQNTITIRIKNTLFDKLNNELELPDAVLDYNNQKAEDVTEEYVDLLSRIKTKKEVEEQYKAILRKAGTISEILEVQDKLRELREEIEAKEGRLQYLQDRETYSTITLTYYQLIDQPEGLEYGFWSKMKDSFEDGWNNIQKFLIGLTSYWPFILLIVIPAWWFIQRRRKQKN